MESLGLKGLSWNPSITWEPADTGAYFRKLHFLTLRCLPCHFHHYFRHGSISGVSESVPIFLLLPNGLNLLYLPLSIISLTFKFRLDHRHYTILITIIFIHLCTCQPSSSSFLSAA